MLIVLQLQEREYCMRRNDDCMKRKSASFYFLSCVGSFLLIVGYNFVVDIYFCKKQILRDYKRERGGFFLFLVV